MCVYVYLRCVAYVLNASYTSHGTMPSFISLVLTSLSLASYLCTMLLLLLLLKKFETEICSMCTWMLNGTVGCAGSLTSGGTESILMAVKAYRDRARKLRPHVTRPNMVLPTTIHPAFEKAGHYFDVDIIHVPVGADCRVDMDAVRAAVDRNTILLVGSAPQYCHCVIDPIEELSEVLSDT